LQAIKRGGCGCGGEFGIAAPIGRNGIEQLLDVIADPTDEPVRPMPGFAWRCWPPNCAS
jgi:hypothetical protein